MIKRVLGPPLSRMRKDDGCTSLRLFQLDLKLPWLFPCLISNLSLSLRFVEKAVHGSEKFCLKNCSTAFEVAICGSFSLFKYIGLCLDQQQFNLSVKSN